MKSKKRINSSSASSDETLSDFAARQRAGRIKEKFEPRYLGSYGYFGNKKPLPAKPEGAMKFC